MPVTATATMFASAHPKIARRARVHPQRDRQAALRQTTQPLSPRRDRHGSSRSVRLARSQAGSIFSARSCAYLVGKAHRETARSQSNPRDRLHAAPMETKFEVLVLK